MPRNHHFDRNPIQKWDFSKDVEHIFLDTPEKLERWKAIKQRMEATLQLENTISKDVCRRFCSYFNQKRIHNGAFQIMQPGHVKPFVIILN